jgi:DNA-binding transcriptional LysR family regulator
LDFRNRRIIIMELRVLEYFLAVAREENISAAANTLHVSQPTLSRQLMDLEKELGKTLFIRGNRKITLTEEGMLLRQRSAEIINIVQKTETDIKASTNDIFGDIYIGACKVLLRTT